MWFDPGLAELFITSTPLHLGEDINLLVVSLMHSQKEIECERKSLSN